MPERLQHWQWLEVHHDLLPALVASDKPKTDEEAEERKREWLHAGYAAMVEAYGYLNRKQRKGTQQ